jgi:hypothetical protein
MYPPFLQERIGPVGLSLDHQPRGCVTPHSFASCRQPPSGQARGSVSGATGTTLAATHYGVAKRSHVHREEPSGSRVDAEGAQGGAHGAWPDLSRLSSPFLCANSPNRTRLAPPTPPPHTSLVLSRACSHRVWLGLWVCGNGFDGSGSGRSARCSRWPRGA